MKKIFALALAVALCLSLVACGGESNASAGKAIVGEWKATNHDISLYFYEDGTCREGQGDLDKWRYDTETGKYVIEFMGMEVKFTIETKDGIRSLTALGLYSPANYVHADDYEKAAANK